MSTANSLPRAASAAPFLCLIECHFEWPLMPETPCLVAFPSALQEQLVQAQVARELRVEAGCPDHCLPAEYGSILVGREHVDLGSDPLDDRRADEHPRERTTGDAVDLERRLERVDLPPVPVAPDRDVEQTERSLIGPPVAHLTGEHDEARAGRQGRTT